MPSAAFEIVPDPPVWPQSVVTVVGNPKPASRTAAVAASVAELLASELGTPYRIDELVDLVTFAPAIFQAEQAGDGGAADRSGTDMTPSGTDVPRGGADRRRDGTDGRQGETDGRRGGTDVRGGGTGVRGGGVDAARVELANAVDLVGSASVLVVATPVYKGSYTGLLKSFLDVLPPQALAGSVVVPVTVAAAPSHKLLADHHLRPVLAELGASVPVPGVTLEERDLDDLQLTVSSWIRANAGIIQATTIALQPVPEPVPTQEARIRRAGTTAV